MLELDGSPESARFVCGCSSKWPTLLSSASEQGRRTNRLYLEVCNKAPVIWGKQGTDTTPFASAVLDHRCWLGHLLPWVHALVCVFNRVRVCLHRISEQCQTTLLTRLQGQEQNCALHWKPIRMKFKLSFPSKDVGDCTHYRSLQWFAWLGYM